MRKFLLYTSAAAGMLAVTGAAQAQLYVNGDQPVLIAETPAEATTMAPSGPEVDVYDTTTADPRVSEAMVEPYLPQVHGGQPQWPTEDVVGDTAPHPLFIEIAERPEPAPQVAATPEPAPEPEALRSKIYFEFDEATLTPEGRAKVDELVAVMRNWDLDDVEIAGHADRSGPRAYNEDLSRARAQTVADAFTAQGMNPVILETEWYGERRPAVPTADGVRLQENRRVEVEAVE